MLTVIYKHSWLFHIAECGFFCFVLFVCLVFLSNFSAINPH